ncbi:hypothetical protein ACIQHZ_31395 [Streptomyces halstedii]|uniref:hypothetical protein n=1 Tax=Streptomyces halstedii TaxID=1944 RepID=UPI0038257F64
MSTAVEWVAGQYPPLANHPMYSSRQKEYSALKKVARRYGIDLEMVDFDLGIAERFGYGMDYEWDRD